MSAVTVYRSLITVSALLVLPSAVAAVSSAQLAKSQHSHAEALLGAEQRHRAVHLRAKSVQRQLHGRDNIYSDPLAPQRDSAAVFRPIVQQVAGFSGSLASSSKPSGSVSNAPGSSHSGLSLSVLDSSQQSIERLQLKGSSITRAALLSGDTTSAADSSSSNTGSGETSPPTFRKLQSAARQEADEITALHALEDSIGQVILNSRNVLTEVVNATNSGSSSGRNGNSSSGPSGFSNGSVPSAAVAAALLPLASSNMRTASSSPLIPAVSYFYKAVNGSEAMPLGLPVSPTPGLVLTRWVLSAWGVSNLSAPAGAVDSAMQRVEQIINNFTRMSPGQVQLTASVNVTFSYALRGIRSQTPAALKGALQQAASDAAGGYDPSFISVMLQPPDFGVKTDQFLDSNPAPVRTVSADQQVVFYPVDSGSSDRYRRSRRLLQQSGSAAAGSVPIAISQAPGVDQPANQTGVTNVWVSYQRLDPLNVTLLLRSLSQSCEGVDLSRTAAARGVNITATPCGRHTRQLLKQAGVNIDDQTYAQLLLKQPMVSVNVRLAVGVTQDQADSSTDSLVALWLAQPRNIAGAINMSGLPDPIGPNALIKWIVTPEVWGAQVLPSPSGAVIRAGLSPGAIAGIVIGAAAFAAIVAGLIVFLVDRRRKQRDEADKTAALSDTSSRRHRRRRTAKPRYLLPVLPVHSEEAAAAATSSQASSDGVAESPSGADDADIDPDQIRPAMKELGDSVTSAARFELDDDDEGHDDVAAQDDRATTRRSGSGAATPFSGMHPVLAAREALIAERQDSRLQEEGVGGLSSSGNTPSALYEITQNVCSESGAQELQPHTDGDGQTASQANQVWSGTCGSTVKHHSGPLGVLEQTGPCTPPRTLPAARSLQSPKTMHESAMHRDFGVVSSYSIGGCVTGGDIGSGVSNESACGVSSRVSKSPFVSSYDFSQLAESMPALDARFSADAIHDVQNNLDLEAPNACTVGMAVSDSITVSVALDGSVRAMST